MIKGKCHVKGANMHQNWETWPEVFAFAPRVGDLVASQSGRCMKIISVTHSFKKEYDAEGFIEQIPYISIELGL